MVDFPFDAIAHSTWGLRDLAVLGGARIEHANTEVVTFEEFVATPAEIRANLETIDVLPSVTLTQNLLAPAQDPNDDTLQLRAGWARTVSRPDFRELSPAVFNAVFGGRQLFGNPDLKRAVIDHYDVRLEWYPRQGELLSIAGFFKDFESPIETKVEPGATPAQSWVNALGARNMGIEADLRKTLFGTGLGFLDRVYVAANGSIIRSRVELDPDSNETDKERPLEGQSPWVVNAQIGYDNGDSKTIATVSFNMAGPRITAVGVDGIPNTIEEPVPRMDVLFQQGLGRDFFVRVRGRNLLDPDIRVSQGEQTIRSGRDGWSALVSLEYRP
jgi:outer membrane receptor protein involved in Fe transport